MRSFKLYGYANSIWNDLTSFVDRDISIPIWTRNKNGTPTTEGFKFGLVDTVSQSILQNIIRIKFSIDNVSRFWGMVNKKQPIITKRIWEYEIFNTLYELDSFNIEYNAIYSLLVNSIDPYKYKSVDNNFFSNVSLPWLLECLLTKKNLPYDASALYLENNNNLIPVHTENYYLKDIRFDLFMLFAINQKVAGYYLTFDSDQTAGYNFSEDKITGLKLFTFLCGVFGITARIENDQYVLERRPNAQTSVEKYIINQSDIYDSSDDQIKTDGKTKSFSMMASSRYNYYLHIPEQIYDLQSFGTVVKGNGGTIDWYNNLVPLLQDKTKAVGETQSMDAGYHLNPAINLNSSLYFKENQYDEAINTLEAAIQNSFFNVDEHFINPRAERSVIKQGVYI